MKLVTLRNWNNSDNVARSYVTSYTLREQESDLFHLDLNKQMGFYQISEFIAVSGDGNFIIEQTNRVGTPKIAAFDKDSGTMLGAFKTNSLIDSSEQLQLTVKRLEGLEDPSLMNQFDGSAEDYAAISPDNEKVIALFIRLPRKNHKSRGLFSRLCTMATQIANPTQDVMEIVMLNDQPCDSRMLYAIAVILHSRGGLQLN